MSDDTTELPQPTKAVKNITDGTQAVSVDLSDTRKSLPTLQSNANTLPHIASETKLGRDTARAKVNEIEDKLIRESLEKTPKEPIPQTLGGLPGGEPPLKDDDTQVYKPGMISAETLPKESNPSVQEAQAGTSGGGGLLGWFKRTVLRQ